MQPAVYLSVAPASSLCAVHAPRAAWLAVNCTNARASSTGRTSRGAHDGNRSIVSQALPSRKVRLALGAACRAVLSMYTCSGASLVLGLPAFVDSTPISHISVRRCFWKRLEIVQRNASACAAGLESHIATNGTSPS